MRDRIKANVTVSLSRVYNIPQKLNGSSIFIAWRRGSNRLSGITKRALVKDGLAIWGESIVLDVPFLRDVDSGEFECKTMSFIIKEDQLGRSRSEKSLAKATIDLSHFVECDGTDTFTSTFRLGKKSKLSADPPITLSFSVASVWLRVNDKDVVGLMGVPDDDGATLSGDHVVPSAAAATGLDGDFPLRRCRGGAAHHLEEGGEVFHHADGGGGGGGAEGDDECGGDRSSLDEDEEAFHADYLEGNVDDVLAFPSEARRYCDVDSLLGTIGRLEEECFERMKTLRTRHAEVHRLKAELRRRKAEARASRAEAALAKDALSKLRATRVEEARGKMSAVVDEMEDHVPPSLHKQRSSRHHRGGGGGGGMDQLVDLVRSQQATIERLQSSLDDATSDAPFDESFHHDGGGGGGGLGAGAKRRGRKGSWMMEQTIRDCKSTILSLTQQLEEKTMTIRAFERRLMDVSPNSALFGESTGNAKEGDDLDLRDRLSAELQSLRQSLNIRSVLEENIYRVEPGFVAGASLARSVGPQRRNAREQKLLSGSSNVVIGCDVPPSSSRDGGLGGERLSGVSISSEKLCSAFVRWGVLPDVWVGGEFSIVGGSSAMSPSEATNAVTEVIDAIEFVSRHSDSIMLAYWLSTAHSIMVRFKQSAGLVSTSIIDDDDDDTHEDVHEDVHDEDGEPSMIALLQELVSMVFKRLLQRFYREASTIVVPSVLELPSLKTNVNVTSTSVIPSTVGTLSTSETLLPLLDRYLTLLRENNVPSHVVHSFIRECFSFIDASVFNHLVAHSHLCKPATGFQLKIELSLFEHWLAERELKKEGVVNSLEHAEHAANVLFMDKGVLLDVDARARVCPSLTIHQILRLLENFVPDDLSDKSIPSKVFTYFRKACNQDTEGSMHPISITFRRGDALPF